MELLCAMFTKKGLTDKKLPSGMFSMYVMKAGEMFLGPSLSLFLDSKCVWLH